MYTELSEGSEGSSSHGLTDAWSHVVAVVSVVESALDKWLTDTYSIGLTEYRAILHLKQASDNELRINKLAQKVGLNMSSVTRLVGRMEAKGLAFRDTCPDDARGVYAVLTDHGTDSIERIHQPYEVRLSELLQGFKQNHPQLNLTALNDSIAAISKNLR